MWACLLRHKKFPAQRKPPKVRFHPRLGGTSYDYKDLVSVGTGSHPARVFCILLHELCHKAVGNDHRHDDLYNRILKAALLDLWPCLRLEGYREHGYDLSYGAEKQLMGFWQVDPKVVLQPLGLSMYTEVFESQLFTKVNRARIGPAFPEGRDQGDLASP